MRTTKRGSAVALGTALAALLALGLSGCMNRMLGAGGALLSTLENTATAFVLTLADHDGVPLANYPADFHEETRNLRYKYRYGGTWAPEVSVQTDGSGRFTATIGAEHLAMWDGRITVTLNQTSLEQDVRAGHATFVATQVRAELRDHLGVELAGGDLAQGGGYWYTHGTTASPVIFYTFPGSLRLRMTWLNVSETRDGISVPSDGNTHTETWTTGQVAVLASCTGGLQIAHGGKWFSYAPGAVVELLPGTYRYRGCAEGQITVEPRGQHTIPDASASLSLSVEQPESRCYNAASWPGTISGACSAGVTRVDVYLDGIHIGVATLGLDVWTYAYTPAADGAYSVQAIAYDARGNAAHSNAVQFIYDTTPPVVTIATPADGTCYAVGAITEVSCEVIDSLDPDPAIISQLPVGSSIDTSTPGDYAFSVTATDCAGNRTTVTHSYHVRAPVFSGLHAPWNRRASVKRGSTFPIKWSYTVCGKLADSSMANPEIRIAAPDGSDLSLIEDAGQSGGPRYDPHDQQWIFSWTTTGLPTGTYRIYIVGSGSWPDAGPFDVRISR